VTERDRLAALQAENEQDVGQVGLRSGLRQRVAPGSGIYGNFFGGLRTPLEPTRYSAPELKLIGKIPTFIEDTALCRI
jgi:hypothetical protein